MNMNYTITNKTKKYNVVSCWIVKLFNNKSNNSLEVLKNVLSKLTMQLLRQVEYLQSGISIEMELVRQTFKN